MRPFPSDLSFHGYAGAYACSDDLSGSCINEAPGCGIGALDSTGNVPEWWISPHLEVN